MGFWDTITDLVDAATPWSTAEAEHPDSHKSPQGDAPLGGNAPAAPAKEISDETTAETDKEEKAEDETAEVKKNEEPAEEEEAEEEPEEEEEEEEEEQDPKDKFEDDCKNSKQCAPAKHHYDECVERVTSQESEGGAKEDCVEEFFHLAHCATQCAAPKLWSTLK
ncbi:hypothetical protein DL546_009877 [Coniochaeta pulveracea]|uniref:Cytochrome b-c1 complex subunit 6, mitochondrial n=1 Tax=Coniochaeta pulveracea TaxID=177199 RepID=A0A420YNC6_9PEZI|nr:hypothetical protein DL546_009877 [Coniochaeta pulveracea]